MVTRNELPHKSSQITTMIWTAGGRFWYFRLFSPQYTQLRVAGDEQHKKLTNALQDSSGGRPFTMMLRQSLMNFNYTILILLLISSCWLVPHHCRALSVQLLGFSAIDKAVQQVTLYVVSRCQRIQPNSKYGVPHSSLPFFVSGDPCIIGDCGNGVFTVNGAKATYHSLLKLENVALPLSWHTSYKIYGLQASLQTVKVLVDPPLFNTSTAHQPDPPLS